MNEYIRKVHYHESDKMGITHHLRRPGVHSGVGGGI